MLTLEYSIILRGSPSPNPSSCASKQHVEQRHQQNESDNKPQTPRGASEQWRYLTELLSLLRVSCIEPPVVVRIRVVFLLEQMHLVQCALARVQLTHLLHDFVLFRVQTQR